MFLVFCFWKKIRKEMFANRKLYMYRLEFGIMEYCKSAKMVVNIIIFVFYLFPIFHHCFIAYFHIWKDYCIYLDTDLSL